MREGTRNNVCEGGGGRGEPEGIFIMYVIVVATHPACDVVAMSHLGLI